LDFGPGGDLWFLFGDAWTGVGSDGQPVPALKKPDGTPLSDDTALFPPYNPYRPFNADPVGVACPYATAENIDERFELYFRQAPDRSYATLEIPGVSLLTNKVPTGAISTPSGVYVFATGTPFTPGGNPAGDGPQRSFVARWSDLTTMKTDPPYEFSQGHFANYLVPVIGGAVGTSVHPTDTEVVWLWGTGFPNRGTSVRLACVTLEDIADRSAWRFFSGIHGARPVWEPDEAQAVKLFENSCVGEFSVAWNQYLGRWLMLYASTDPRGILCRWAPSPWGPWAEGIIIFDPWKDNGYGHFMHFPGRDDVSDPDGEGQPGGEYAPIIIPRYTVGSETWTKIRYVMSTWNPYTAVIMESELYLSSWLDARKPTVGP
jgi:hypothetical protein